jgi:hypothetical protein
MFDAFPWEGTWADLGEQVTTFWTFGPGGDDPSRTGTYVLTVLGIILMVVALVGWFLLENRKLAHQAALLRAAGGLPAPGGVPPGPGPSQPPLAGPATDPGD